jgi:hypothetical protein
VARPVFGHYNKDWIQHAAVIESDVAKLVTATKAWGCLKGIKLNSQLTSGRPKI